MSGVNKYLRIGSRTRVRYLLLLVALVVFLLSLMSYKNRQIVLENTDRPFNSVAWRNDGSIILAGDDGGNIEVWEISGHKHLATLHGHEDAVQSIAWSPSGEYFASVGFDSLVVWKYSDLQILQRININLYASNLVMWNTTGDRLSNGGLLKSAIKQVWDVGSLNLISEFNSRMNTVDLNPEMTSSAYVDSKHNIIIDDIDSLSDIVPISSDERIPPYLVWSPNGNRFATSSDQDIDIYENGEFRKIPYVGGGEQILAFMWDESSTSLLTASLDQTIRVWNVKDGVQLVKIQVPDNIYLMGRQEKFRWNSERHIFASFGSNSPEGYPNTVLVFNTQTGTIIDIFNFGAWVLSVDISPDANYIACSGDFGFKIFDLNAY